MAEQNPAGWQPARTAATSSRKDWLARLCGRGCDSEAETARYSNALGRLAKANARARESLTPSNTESPPETPVHPPETESGLTALERLLRRRVGVGAEKRADPEPETKEKPDESSR